ncbi:alpha/beta hydrolase [candidate division KSB1 bacterium]|nr:alpha/beta hydrolase [candidate division KSB1 bacterium]
MKYIFIYSLLFVVLGLVVGCTTKNQDAMNLPATQRAEINGVQLEIRDRGTGEPVVFVHGAMGDECAAVVAEPALVTKYRVIDYHLRGWGGSDRVEATVSIAQHAADCRAVMQHLGVERAHLVGQSSGGVILLQLAKDFPEAVHTLALLEPALPSILFSSPEFKEIVAKAGSLYESGDISGAIETFAQEVAGADYRTVFDRTLPPGYFERWVADADALFKYPSLDVWRWTREDAAHITQPVLNMRGANTKPYFREIHERVRQWLPHAENFVLPNATHAMLQTNPKGAAERLASFFSSHRLPE